jgi:hypothetical protein
MKSRLALVVFGIVIGFAPLLLFAQDCWHSETYNCGLWEGQCDREVTGEGFDDLDPCGVQDQADSSVDFAAITGPEYWGSFESYTTQTDCGVRMECYVQSFGELQYCVPDGTSATNLWVDHDAPSDYGC